MFSYSNNILFQLPLGHDRVIEAYYTLGDYSCKQLYVIFRLLCNIDFINVLRSVNSHVKLVISDTSRMAAVTP